MATSSNSNFTILKSGYTKNIKNPVLFNKLLSKPTYSKITNEYIEEVASNSTKDVYIKFPVMIDVRLFDKLSEELDSYIENAGMSYPDFPAYAYYYDNYENEYNKNNMSLCSNGCEFKDYNKETKKSK